MSEKDYLSPTLSGDRTLTREQIEIHRGELCAATDESAWERINDLCDMAEHALQPESNAEVLALREALRERANSPDATRYLELFYGDHLLFVGKWLDEDGQATGEGPWIMMTMDETNATLSSQCSAVATSSGSNEQSALSSRLASAGVDAPNRARAAQVCERKAAHVRANADALKKFDSAEQEARCRELAAMYLDEVAEELRDFPSLEPLRKLAKVAGVDAREKQQQDN